MNNKLFYTLLLALCSTSLVLSQNKIIKKKCTHSNKIGETKTVELLIKVGYWEKYYDNGNIMFKGNFSKKIKECRPRFVINENFYSGIKIGMWKEYYENGQLESEGNYDNDGNKIGEWKEYYDNGQLKSKETIVFNKSIASEFVSGYVPIGESIEYYKNGQLRNKKIYDSNFNITEEHNYYDNGQLKYQAFYNKNQDEIGTHLKYYEDGTLSNKRVFDENAPGELIYEYDLSYYESLSSEDKSYVISIEDKIKNTIVEETYSSDGVIEEKSIENSKSSIFEDYYKNGQLKSIELYDKNENKTGEWKKYYENGQLKSVTTYKRGKKVGERKEYYENGQLKVPEYSGEYIHYQTSSKVSIIERNKNLYISFIGVNNAKLSKTNKKDVYKIEENGDSITLIFKLDENQLIFRTEKGEIVFTKNTD